jgi:hypothetical protein
MVVMGVCWVNIATQLILTPVVLIVVGFCESMRGQENDPLPLFHLRKVYPAAGFALRTSVVWRVK